MAEDTIHSYGPNTFKLHRLPVPRPGQVLGLVGTNGIGKSTTLNILAGNLKPNLGRFDNPPGWQEIVTYFQGSELQNYFTRILDNYLKARTKPQHINCMQREFRENVGEVLERKDQKDVKSELCALLELDQVIDRKVRDLSRGELQRFAIAVVAIQNADIYMFDEPSLYLDVKQRLKAAKVIRSLIRPNNYVVVVEHDLSVLDYLSDFICCLYGKPGAYGVVTLPFSVREGINIYLAGFVPTENLRLRDDSLAFNFKVADTPQESADEAQTYVRYKYPTMTKTQGNFKLRIVEGECTDSQITVMLGENGTGKTTFIRMLAGLLKPDSVEGGFGAEMPEFNVSYKPQDIMLMFQSTIRQLLHQRIGDVYTHPQFVSDVMQPLLIEQLMDQEIVNLTDGELQRVAVCLRLGGAALSKSESVEGGFDVEMPEFNVPYEPHEISFKFQSTVRHLLHQKIYDAYTDPRFVSDVMKPLLIEQLMDQRVVRLSLEELQRVALCLCLGKPADIYLIDEPSAYIDSEQRIRAAKVIKRFIVHAKKTALVVEHDFIMATYLADRVIVYEGRPSIDCIANAPQSLLSGMNLFLSQLDITFTRDPTNFCPRINKIDSTKDKEQKSVGCYYYLGD